ncbi:MULTISPECIES: hypothetical protein [Acidobacteriaceae]|uniref:hypothetical protein n=1 Tax=Acidobacteriaceae TaxID=204434 RepID=UPI00131A7834|nr:MULTISPECIES: hypothetical protein [Acidobacteriaceae]MDW5267481.1 hypothetical protein [Edaphobacter sp.]
MSRYLKSCIATLALIAAAASVACAQAVPAGTMSPSVGPSLPSVDGVFHYALRASEMVEIGSERVGTGNSAVFSGDAAYNSTSVVHPFSMIYAGGLILGNEYGGHATSFQNLAISQGLVAGRWHFAVSDSVSYLPETPTLGLSGIPGVGDLGSGTGQGVSSGPAGGVLTNNATNVSNALTGNVERELTPLTSISGSGDWSMLRFPKGEGLENTQYSGNLGLNHRLDARDTISGSALYSTYSYGGGIGLTMQTRGITAAFERTLSSSLKGSASAGPMWLSSSNSALIPSRVTVSTNLNLSYIREITQMSVSYSRGVNGGSGVQPGALSDDISASIGRSYGPDWRASLSGNYTHTSGLLQEGALVGSSTSLFPYAGGTTNLTFAGVQVSRKLTDSFSAFATYNIQHQSIDDSLSTQNAFSGLTQTFGVGITFSPRSTSLGQF